MNIFNQNIFCSCSFFPCWPLCGFDFSEWWGVIFNMSIFPLIRPAHPPSYCTSDQRLKHPQGRKNEDTEWHLSADCVPQEGGRTGPAALRRLTPTPCGAFGTTHLINTLVLSERYPLQWAPAGGSWEEGVKLSRAPQPSSRLTAAKLTHRRKTNHCATCQMRNEHKFSYSAQRQQMCTRTLWL